MSTNIEEPINYDYSINFEDIIVAVYNNEIIDNIDNSSDRMQQYIWKSNYTELLHETKVPEFHNSYSESMEIALDAINGFLYIGKWRKDQYQSPRYCKLNMHTLAVLDLNVTKLPNNIINGVRLDSNGNGKKQFNGFFYESIGNGGIVKHLGNLTNLKDLREFQSNIKCRTNGCYIAYSNSEYNYIYTFGSYLEGNDVGPTVKLYNVLLY